MLQPLPDEPDLLGRHELRRAQVEQERPVRGQADPGAERLARPARRPVEPVVEGRGPGHDHAVRRHAVHRDRLLLHRIVPDGHEIDRSVNQALVRQVVPAGHAQRAADALKEVANEGLPLGLKAADPAQVRRRVLLLVAVVRPVAVGRKAVDRGVDAEVARGMAGVQLALARVEGGRSEGRSTFSGISWNRLILSAA